MGQKLEGKRVAFLATDGVEQVELTEPWKAVEEEGGTPELISLESGEIQGFNHLDKGDTFRVDRTVDEAERRRLRRPGAAGWRRQPGLPAYGREGRELRALVLRGRQAGRRDLPRPVDARRGRRAPRPHDHLVAEPPNRHPQRGRQLGRRGGRRGRRPRLQPQARTISRPSATSWSRRSARASTRIRRPAPDVKRRFASSPSEYFPPSAGIAQLNVSEEEGTL